MVLGAAAGAVSALAVRAYQRWHVQQRRKLAFGSELVRTELGLIEYFHMGEGPVVLVFHGAPGGYDQALMYRDLVGEGFSVLGFSRPGYVRTPLDVGRSPEAQADAALALLDSLGIADVIALGVSAGGPAAIQFTLRYPSRTRALVLQAAVTKPYVPSDLVAENWFGRLFMNDVVQDVVMYAMSELANKSPSLALREMLKVESTLSEAEIERTIADVMSRPDDIEQFQALIASTVPMRLRKIGLDNDLAVLASLPVYPLETITTPTLIIHSEFDGDVPVDHATTAGARIPDAELLIVGGAGHLMWLGETGKIVQQATVDFLRTATA